MANTSAGVLPPLTGYGFQALYTSFTESVSVNTTKLLFTIVSAPLNTQIIVTTTNTGNFIINVELNELAQITNTFTILDIVNIAFKTIIHAGYTLPVYDHNSISEVWVLNLETKAVSRYSNFYFNSYSVFDGHIIGAADDGLYILDANDDSLQFLVDFGTVDLGNTNHKRLSNAYVGCSTNGTIYIKLSDGENSYTYEARAVRNVKDVQRFDFGRGLISNYFDIELIGVGSGAEISDIEFIPLYTNRKI